MRLFVSDLCMCVLQAVWDRGTGCVCVCVWDKEGSGTALITECVVWEQWAGKSWLDLLCGERLFWESLELSC